MRLKLSGEPESMFIVEDVLLEMRKDLGHPNRGFNKGDILRLFVNDIDKYLNNNSSKTDNATKKVK
jgi:hypothetical protein